MRLERSRGCPRTRSTRSWKPSGGGPKPCSRLGPTLRGMISSAEASAAEWRAMASAPKRLECLTVYLGNACTMGCAYCYAAAQAGFPRPRGPGEASSVPLEAVLAAARLVARSCAERSTPFNVALHGGGEPTLHWELLPRDRGRAQTRRAGLRPRAAQSHRHQRLHVRREGRVARGESLVYLPLLRRTAGDPGSPASDPRRLARLAGPGAHGDCLRGRGGLLRDARDDHPRDHGRADAHRRLPHRRHGRRGNCASSPCTPSRGRGSIPSGRRRPGTTRKPSSRLECHAARAGAELSYSGVDLSRLHGSFCESARDVLHLRPDGSISSCFFSVEDGHPSSSGIRIGQYDPSTDDITIEDEAWSESRARAFSIPSRCRSCLAAYHCSRSCPERCVATPPGRGGAAASFRCELNRILAEVWILDTAGKIGEGPAREAAGGPAFSAPGPDDAPLEPFLDLDDPDIDAAAITEQWRAARAYFQERDAQPSLADMGASGLRSSWKRRLALGGGGGEENIARFAAIDVRACTLLRSPVRLLRLLFPSRKGTRRKRPKRDRGTDTSLRRLPGRGGGGMGKHGGLRREACHDGAFRRRLADPPRERGARTHPRGVEGGLPHHRGHGAGARVHIEPPDRLLALLAARVGLLPAPRRRAVPRRRSEGHARKKRNGRSRPRKARDGTRRRIHPLRRPHLRASRPLAEEFLVGDTQARRGGNPRFFLLPASGIEEEQALHFPGIPRGPRQPWRLFRLPISGIHNDDERLREEPSLPLLASARRELVLRPPRQGRGSPFPRRLGRRNHRLLRLPPSDTRCLSRAKREADTRRSKAP